MTSNESVTVHRHPIIAQGESRKRTGVKKQKVELKKCLNSPSSVLSARRKVAWGITTKTKDHVLADDIDESDINNELAEVEYVKEIYDFYKVLESEGGLRDYMDSQPDITAYKRAILIDWLIEVHVYFDMMPESLYLAVNIIDRYLSVKTVIESELQLLGITALLLSSKYEELQPSEVNNDLVNVNSMIDISDNTYSREQILAMESDILSHLSWNLTVPTPYMFTVRYTKASLPSDNEVVNMAFFYTELGLMDYLVTISNNPSKLAASAVYAARCTLNKTPAWTETLRHYTGYMEDQILDCAKSLVSFHACAGGSKLKIVYEKYVNPNRGAVALLPPATSLWLGCNDSALVCFTLNHFASIGICCFRKGCKCTKTSEKSDMVHVDEHLKVSENIFQGPNGMKTVAITVDDDLHVHDKGEFAKNEKLGEGYDQTARDGVSGSSTSSQA